MTPIRWKRFYPGGAQEEYVLKQYDPPGYPALPFYRQSPQNAAAPRRAASKPTEHRAVSTYDL